MKKLLSIAMSVFILLPTLTMTASAIADTNSTDTTTATTTEDKTAAQNTETETESDKKSRLVRLEQAKKKFAAQANLTEAVKKHIGEKCVAAQSNLKAHRLAKTPIMDKYSEAYDKIVTKLDETAAGLKSDGKDTTALEADIVVLKSKVATFKSSITSFQQALKDLGMLDCKTDPAGFKVSLEAARTAQQAVLTASKDVHSYLKDTVKPALQALKEKEVKTTN